MKNQIIELLKSTEREGIENLIEHMENNGFFESPCSSQYHLCKEGGLAEHSLNVYVVMNDMCYSLSYCYNGDYEVDVDKYNSMILVSLLHDLGKMGQYGKRNYVENMISDKKGGFKQSDKKPFTTNSTLLSVPHEIRSIHIASQFIELTEEESFAILHHNGLYGDLKYAYSGKETPLSMLLHFADLWASRVIEKENKEVVE
jgi:23S rRNA maturation-related 3'-5' exoribonuclease YhaM